MNLQFIYREINFQANDVPQISALFCTLIF